jgi:hypothetical protein
MSARPVPSLKSAREAIFSLDLGQIVDKITRTDNALTGIEKPWSRAKAEEAVELYKRYLWLVRKHRERHPFLPPSREIDFIWHAHILDTRRYHEDCDAIFGAYHHHDPYFGLNGPADEKHLRESFDLTQQLHFTEFGDYIYELDDEEPGNEP